MSNLQPAQFGNNPFMAVGGMLSSAGSGGWFRRRAELRHAYNMGVINQHFANQNAQRDQSNAKDLITHETNEGIRKQAAASESRIQEATMSHRQQMARARQEAKLRPNTQQAPKPTLWTP